MRRNRVGLVVARLQKFLRTIRSPGEPNVAAPGTADCAEVEIFKNLLEMADQIAAHNPGGVLQLVSAILRPLQAEQMLSVAERPRHAALSPVDFEQLFSPDYFFSYFNPEDCLQVPVEGHQVDLGRDVVLPTPWAKERFAASLAFVGAGKQLGIWRQDSNHGILLVLPWRIGIVTGGNHSITAGILANEGKVSPTNVVDLGPLLDRVKSDGVHFICRQSGRRLAKVRDARMAALFELGRYIGPA
ncbi:DUF6710 family protein [Massilia sp. NP310]|uniref:DUF6710 family protein n=1 Tax=Massilia sp. NP310 TaxID=2861282 RepID=UPI0035A33CFD